MSDLVPDRIETDRLRLESFDPDAVDAFDLYEILSSDPGLEDVFEYVPQEPHATPMETLDLLERNERRRGDGERASYAIRPKEPEPGAGEIAGMTALFLDWDRRRAEPGIILRKRFWGRGYSGERAAALLAVAFERLDVETVSVTCLRENDRSRRAISKYVEAHGGTYDGCFRNARAIDGDPVDLHRYTITKDEYEAATPDADAPDRDPFTVTTTDPP